MFACAFFLLLKYSFKKGLEDISQNRGKSEVSKDKHFFLWNNIHSSQYYQSRKRK